MLLSEIEIGDLLHWDCIENGVMISRPILVLDISPTPNEPNVSVLDAGVECHVRNTQLWPIEEDAG